MITAWNISARLSRGIAVGAVGEFMGATALFLEKPSNATGRNPIPERLSCLQGATRKNSMMPVGDKSLRMSRSARLAAHTQKLSRSITAVSWLKTSTRRLGLIERRVQAVTRRRGGELHSSYDDRTAKVSRLRLPTSSAGLPATIVAAPTLVITTDPAPTTAASPISIPGPMNDRAATQHSSPIFIGALTNANVTSRQSCVPAQQRPYGARKQLVDVAFSENETAAGLLYIRPSVHLVRYHGGNATPVSKVINSK